jgi:putative ATP-binding cassette transporter
MYSLLLEKLPQTTVLSVAHRNSVAKYHQHCWRFKMDDEGQCNMTASSLPSGLLSKAASQ